MRLMGFHFQLKWSHFEIFEGSNKWSCRHSYEGIKVLS